MSKLSIITNTAKPQVAWVAMYLRQYKKLLLLVLFLAMATFACAIGLMFISGYLISDAARQPENILLLYIPIVLTRAFGIARTAFHYLERLSSHDFVLRMTSTMRLRLYKALDNQLSTKRNHRTGEILGLVADDIDSIQNLYLRIIFPSAVLLLLYACVIIALGMFSVLFALFMLLWLGIMLIIVPLVSLCVNGARKTRQKELQKHNYQSLTDTVLGMRDYIYGGRENDFLQKYSSDCHASETLKHKNQSFSRKRDLAFQLMACMAIVSMLLFINHMSSQSGINANMIAAFVLAIFPLVEGLAPLPEAISNLPSYQDSVHRLLQIEKTSVSDTKPQHSSLPTNSICLTINNLHFSYANNAHVINGISFQLNPKEKLAILGPSGAGKSTLIGLIRGELIPHSGSVLLSGIPSVDIRHKCAEYIGVLGQRPYLFNTSIANNIRMGNPQATDEEILDAAKKAGLGEVLDKIPNGLNTSVAEAGARFSGGERQRIALARILLQKTPLVILDEPTIGLDPEKEMSLTKVFLEALNEKSLIWITHHLRGIKHMDNIIFLDKGRISMKGNHGFLWNTSQRYRNLYAMDSAVIA